MGHNSITVTPAVIYSVVYCLYASMLAPFVGFFASGFKRAVDIKDFGTTLPGHGGLIDRLDCITIMSIFNYVFLTQIILKEESALQNASDSINMLQTSD